VVFWRGILHEEGSKGLSGKRFLTKLIRWSGTPGATKKAFPGQARYLARKKDMRGDSTRAAMKGIICYGRNSASIQGDKPW
jgi:hypothetical protein